MYDVTKSLKMRQWRHISSYVHFINKMSRCNVFQNENPYRMSYLRTLYDHVENFQKIKFQWERIFEKTLAFCEFSTYFQSKSSFDLTKDKRIEMRGSSGSREYFCFSHCLTPRPNNSNNCYLELTWLGKLANLPIENTYLAHTSFRKY